MYVIYFNSLFITQIHWIVANNATTAARTTLGENHPIRRLLKVFTFGTGAINMASAFALAPENSLYHRMTGFTYKGYSDLLR